MLKADHTQPKHCTTITKTAIGSLLHCGNNGLKLSGKLHVHSNTDIYLSQVQIYFRAMPSLCPAKCSILKTVFLYRHIVS